MRPEDVKRVFQNNADDLVEWTNKGTTRAGSSVEYLWHITEHLYAQTAHVVFSVPPLLIVKSQESVKYFFLRGS